MGLLVSEKSSHVKLNGDFVHDKHSVHVVGMRC